MTTGNRCLLYVFLLVSPAAAVSLWSDETSPLIREVRRDRESTMPTTTTTSRNGESRSFGPSMLSRGHEYHLAPGSPLSLDCEFYMEGFHAFHNPVIWVKSQSTAANGGAQRVKINIMGIIQAPFSDERDRFDVSLIKQPPRYQLLLTVKDVRYRDSGNYTCEVHGKRATVLSHVTYTVYVIENVSSVTVSVGGVPNATQKQNGVLRLTADVGVDLECKVVGGLPPPSVDIFLDGINITEEFTLRRSETVTGRRGFGRFDVISSLSTPSFVAETHQHGQRLECVALVDGSVSVSASTRLHVIYEPHVTCWSTKAAVGQLRVCLSCLVDARPASHTVFWASDSAGTDLTAASMSSVYWPAITDRGNGLLETTLCFERVVQRAFRTYYLIAVNTLGRRAEAVELQQAEINSQQPIAVQRTTPSLFSYDAVEQRARSVFSLTSSSASVNLLRPSTLSMFYHLLIIFHCLTSWS